ncbi:uncharacterized protein LOC132735820 [Ruditapes philippinarum]|uniref:uncharacterized protein LOC132735820 n=1 Tax=Ruditapes philippinarum TaxID=129788 RepID=UPI00295BF488|nr:uncharacterized protein LOC132735820 [Ruditapes philippinarum]
MPKRRADETVRLASAVNEKRRQAQRTPGSNPNPRQEVVQIDDSSPTSGEVNFQSNIILSAHVSQSIKEKIWCNNYIELQHLLPKVKPDSAGKQKIQFENGELILCPNEQSPKSLENIESWTDAFHIFIAIYILKHPDEIGNLLQYMANIRQAATRHIGWAAYDSSFRLKKSVNESLRWETIDPELWMLSMQPIQAPVFSDNLASAKQNPGVLNKKLYEDKTFGWIVGPFKQPPISNLRINAVGLVPKRSGDWRLITNLSFPPNNSVNEFIEPDYRHVKDMRDDAMTWLTFLSEFNGLAMFNEKNWSENTFIELYTDASGNKKLGCGCYFKGQWCAFKWPAHWEEFIFRDITVQGSHAVRENGKCP